MNQKINKDGGAKQRRKAGAVVTAEAVMTSQCVHRHKPTNRHSLIVTGSYILTEPTRV